MNVTEFELVVIKNMAVAMFSKEEMSDLGDEEKQMKTIMKLQDYLGSNYYEHIENCVDEAWEEVR